MPAEPVERSRPTADPTKPHRKGVETCPQRALLVCAHVGSRRGQSALVAGIVVVALSAGAAWASPLRVLIRHSPNMTRSNRTARTIDAIVIHSTEGRFVGSVRYLQHRRTRGSAHFVVSRLGQVVQLVP